VSFTELGLQPNLATRLINLGYIRPTPAHNKVIPDILHGANLLIGSPVGAGFAESAMISIINLSVTQANSNQVHIILSASDDHKLIYEQQLQLLMGNQIPIALMTNIESFVPPTTQASIWISTPQEFLNYLQESSTNQEISYTLLLNETDEMIARGAKPALLAVSEYISKQCQVIICTSKITKSIKTISRSLQHRPKWYRWDSNNQKPENTAHQAWPVPKTLKSQLLLKLSSKLHNAKAILLVRDEQFATKIARRIRTRKLRAAAVMVGNELEIFRRFESNDITLLILADGLKKSIPLEGVTHIIHYDLPDKPQGYLDITNKMPGAIHMSIITPSDEESLIEIEDIMQRPLSRNTLTNFDYKEKVSKSAHANTTRKKKRRPKRRRKKQTKTEWDPEVPRTWGDRNAMRANPDKTPLEDWSPSPLPSIWSDKNPNKHTKTVSRKKRSVRRYKKHRRNRNGNKSSRSKQQ
tara:strand:- start:83720 stop:85123 length:1404 start_codon:yes stop_codon:yes gene_type:complete